MIRKNKIFHFHMQKTSAHKFETLGADIHTFFKSIMNWSLVVSLMICIINLLPQKSFSQQLSTNKDKFLGCATSSNLNRNLNNYWNQVTPGNDGKWGSVTYARGQYNWTDLDFIYNYTINRGLLYKHHTLVWGSQQPAWIAGLDSANQRAEVENWIRLVGQRYPKMSMIDVVNEPFHTPLPSYKNALGGDGKTGWDWVITAFQLARQYCAAGVKLILNEYNVLHDNTITTNYINLINLLKDRGLIDGIGIQGHYFEFRGEITGPNPYVWDINTIKNNLNRLTALGLPVYITEFDIDEQDDANQLSQYKIYFPIFWSNPGVKGITFWGYIQNDIWISHPYTYLLLTDGTERPSLQWLRTYTATPLAPILISPSVSAVGVQRTPAFIWSSSTSATKYHLQVATDILFSSSSIVVDTTTADTLLKLSPLATNTNFFWRVSAANEYGTSEYSIVSSFTTGQQVAAKELAEIPREFKMSQNFPNPFNPTTTIKFSIPIRSYVSLSLFNTLGQVVKIITNVDFEAGNHQVTLDANSLASGIYFYKLSAGDYTDIKKLLLMK